MVTSTRRRLGGSSVALCLFVLCMPGRAVAEHGDCRRIALNLALLGAGVGFGIGAGVDAIVREKKIVYLAPGEPSSRTLARSFRVLQNTLRTGDAAWVTTTQTDQEVKGRVIALSDTTLTFVIDGQPHVMPEGTVRKIRRRSSDSVWNGALIGAGIGLLPLVGIPNCG